MSADSKKFGFGVQMPLCTPSGCATGCSTLTVFEHDIVLKACMSIVIVQYKMHLELWEENVNFRQVHFFAFFGQKKNSNCV